MPANFQPDNPAKIARNRAIVADRLLGMTTREIAERHNLASNSHVSAILRTDEAQELMKAESYRLYPAVRDIIDHQLMHIQTAGKIHAAFAGQGPLPEMFCKSETIVTNDKVIHKTENDLQAAIKYVDGSAKKEEGILKATGVLPSNQTNYYTQMIYNDNRSLTLDSGVLNALSGVIDVDSTMEVIDDEQSTEQE